MTGFLRRPQMKADPITSEEYWYEKETGRNFDGGSLRSAGGLQWHAVPFRRALCRAAGICGTDRDTGESCESGCAAGGGTGPAGDCGCEWQDAEDGPSGGQCRLSIDCGANGIYGIDIRWDDSRWRFTGTYDEIWEGIDYIGARYSEQTLDGGEIQSTAVLEEETGMLYLDEGGVLQWEDTFEHMGENMKFGRVS